MASVYRAPQPLPRILTTDEIIPATRRHIQARRSLIESILQTVSPSTACFDNVIAPLATLRNSECGERAVIDALKYGSSDRATQAAVEEAAVLWADNREDYTTRSKLLELIKAVKDKSEPLDCESEKLVAAIFEDYTPIGPSEMSIEDRLSWEATMQEIEGLKTEFTRNLRHYHGTLSFTDEELDGVPKIEVESYQIGPDGKRQVSVNGRDDSTVMRYANNPETRKRMLEAHGMKVPQNVALFKRLFQLRDLNARRAGLKSHAAFRLPDRMAESTEWIDNLLESLAEKLHPLGKRYALRLEAKKRSHLASNIAKMEPWDIPYYRRLIEEEAAVDHKRISEYFPLRPTVGAMLDLFAACLQLHFAPIPAEELKGSTWSDDIEVWSVWDKRPTANGAFIGCLYTDLLERPNKYKGSQCVNLQPGYLRNDGTRVYPVTTLMCSFPPPAPTGCTLLTHSNVKSLFHELGHGMHDLLARTKYARFHGYNVPREFGEGIGTMLENFCWIKDGLKAMSCHYTEINPKYREAWQEANPGCPLPPKTIPDELVENLIQSRPVSRLLHYLDLLVTSKFDMAVYNPKTHEDALSLDEVELFKDLYEQFRFYRPLDPSHLHVLFRHIVLGMDAGYYSYVCSNVFAEELFQEVFAKDPMSKEAWERFRRGILEIGGSRDESKVLEEFLGHPPTPDPLLRSIGLPQPS